MVATINKGFKMSVVLGVLFMFLAVFMSPVVAFASSPSPSATTDSNNAIPGVTVNDDGTLTISGTGFGDGSGSGFNQIISKYRNFIVGISGIAAITMVVIFIFQFLKLGSTAGNPQARSQALTGVLWSGVAAAGLGSVSLIVGLFYNSIK